MKARYCIKQTTCKFLRIGYELGKKGVGENRRFEKSSEGLIVSGTILESIDKLQVITGIRLWLSIPRPLTLIHSSGKPVASAALHLFIKFWTVNSNAKNPRTFGRDL